MSHIDATLWSLDPAVSHLNHGSFGAVPVAVQAEQARWRDAMEANPVRFMLEQYQPALEVARTALAEFVGADPEGLVFVRNATEGVSAVLRSLAPRFGPGDEIVVTTHGYNACSNAARYVCEITGARLVEVDLPYPITDSRVVTSRVLDAIGPATRFVLVDHVSSPTGIVFPVGDIVAAVGTEIPVMVDGAHAPGMVALDLAAIGASFSVGNCHKWLGAPKGAGYLHVAERYRDSIVAPTISHSYNGGWPGSSSHFHAHFDWTGTDDPSARLSIPAALTTMGSLHPQGWPGLMAANHELVCAGRNVLCDALAIVHPAPDDMLGSIAAVPLPPDYGSQSIFDPLTISLRHNHRIEVPVFTWPAPPQRLLRISAQHYNRLDEYVRLAEALLAELG